MAHEVTLITGDGVGPELARAARRCVEATGVKIDWDVQEAGSDCVERTGTPLPESVMESIARTRCALKAPITTPVGTGFRSINVHLRQELGLFACVRPCKYYPGVRSFFTSVPVDLVVVRENTEDLYAGIEFERGRPATGELIGGDIAAQTERVLANLGAVLSAASLGFADVIKTTIYLADMADFAAVNAVYARYFPTAPPARACIQVAALPKGARIEIEAIAACP